MAVAAQSPKVSFSMEKMTSATPFDRLLLVRLDNYRNLGLSRKHSVIKSRENKWEISAVKIDNDCEFCLMLLGRGETKSFRLKAALALVTSNGSLAHLTDLRNFQMVGDVIKLQFQCSTLTAWSSENYLKLLVWISKIPGDKVYSHVFELFRFGCTKDQFIAHQSAVKADLLGDDSGLQHYGSRHNIDLPKFENIFDRELLPTFFNFDDSVVSIDGVDNNLWNLTIHNYESWKRSGLPLRFPIIFDGGREWIVTVTSGAENQIFTLSTENHDSNQFRICFGLTLGDLSNELEASDEGVMQDVLTISLPQTVCDNYVEMECLRFEVYIWINNGLGSPVYLRSPDGAKTLWSSETCAKSEMMRTALEKYTDTYEHGIKVIKSSFDRHTLECLESLAVVDIDKLSAQLDRIEFSSPSKTEVLERGYRAAHFYLMTDLMAKIVSILGYEPPLL